MLKKSLILGSIIALVLSVTIISQAETLTNDPAENLHCQVGWQYSQPTTGFSIKIPVLNKYYLQPIFAFQMTQKPGTSDANANGHFALGIRGICQLPARSDFQPYTGVSIGHSEDFSGTALSTATITTGETGITAFLGVEYRKYIFRPSVEIGLGSFNKSDGSYDAGTILNFACMYSF